MQSTPSSEKPAPATVAAALREAASLLGQRLEAEVLLAHSLERDRAWLYAHADEAITDKQWRSCQGLVRQRLDGRPVAYLLEEREFYGRPLRIGDGVLIPRPETELLVDLALSLALRDDARICDVGTGSGCIALTLAAERPAWHVTGIDISSDALAFAAENRSRLGVENVELLCGDLLAPVADRRFDLIVSNPPYVADGDKHLERGDLRFEPREALAAGADGLDLIRRLLPQAHERLEAGGWFLVEHGHDQAEAVRALLANAGFSNVESRRDLAGIERVSIGRFDP